MLCTWLKWAIYKVFTIFILFYKNVLHIIYKPTMVHPFREYIKSITALRNNKAAGGNDVLVELLMHLGPNANKWLHTMLKIWRQSTILIILKTRKVSAIQ